MARARRETVVADCRGRCHDVAVELRTSAAIDWLLRSDEPAIRLLARRDVLGEPPGRDVSGISSGPMVTALLSGQHNDGGFGRDPYRKWTGVHWRLISLAELGVPPSDPRAAAAAERVLTWITRGLRHPPEVIDGLVRAHGSVQGNALGACCRLGLAGDPRAQHLAESLICWQWPDGGWNCDREATGYRSSFHETIGAAWGLHEYGQATGDLAARAAADRAAELFLGAPADPSAAYGRDHRLALVEASLSAVLALRHPAGAPRADPDGAGARPARRRWSRRTGAPSPAGRSMAGRRTVVEAGRQLDHSRRCRMGPLRRTEPDDHAQRLARPAGRQPTRHRVRTPRVGCGFG
jgi:hypothetical protein